MAYWVSILTTEILFSEKIDGISFWTVYKYVYGASSNFRQNDLEKLFYSQLVMHFLETGRIMIYSLQFIDTLQNLKLKSRSQELS